VCEGTEGSRMRKCLQECKIMCKRGLTLALVACQLLTIGRTCYSCVTPLLCKVHFPDEPWRKPLTFSSCLPPPISKHTTSPSMRLVVTLPVYWFLVACVCVCVCVCGRCCGSCSCVCGSVRRLIPHLLSVVVSSALRGLAPSSRFSSRRPIMYVEITKSSSADMCESEGVLMWTSV
jgi:hypothetical protein